MHDGIGLGRVHGLGFERDTKCLGAVVNCASEKSDGTMLSAAARVDDVAIALERFRSAASPQVN